MMQQQQIFSNILGQFILGDQFYFDETENYINNVLIISCFSLISTKQ